MIIEQKPDVVFDNCRLSNKSWMLCLIIVGFRTKARPCVRLFSLVFKILCPNHLWLVAAFDLVGFYNNHGQLKF